MLTCCPDLLTSITAGMLLAVFVAATPRVERQNL